MSSDGKLGGCHLALSGALLNALLIRGSSLRLRKSLEKMDSLFMNRLISPLKQASTARQLCHNNAALKVLIASVFISLEIQ